MSIMYDLFLRNIDVKEIYLVRKHKNRSFHTLDRWLYGEIRRADVHYISMQHVPTLRTLKN